MIFDPIDAVYNFYHDNYGDGDYNVQYNGHNLGKIYVRFHCQANKWNIVLPDLPDLEETNFSTKGKVIYNDSKNHLEIKQYGISLTIYP